MFSLVILACLQAVLSLEIVCPGAPQCAGVFDCSNGCDVTCTGAGTCMDALFNCTDIVNGCNFTCFNGGGGVGVPPCINFAIHGYGPININCNNVGCVNFEVYLYSKLFSKPTRGHFRFFFFFFVRFFFV